MCVCAIDSGTADFREGVLADRQGLAQIITLSEAHVHANPTSTPTWCTRAAFAELVGVLCGCSGCVCAAADGDDLLTCV